MRNITDGPHYEIQSTELADWIERQGIERWWSVDGDPILGGRRAFPAPADLLAAELRKLNRPLLVQAREGDTQARGQQINAEALDNVVGSLIETYPQLRRDLQWDWVNDFQFYLSWVHSPKVWRLYFNRRFTNLMAKELARARGSASEGKE